MVTDPTTGNPTTGPLLDWWYVHAGYAGLKDGISRSWDVPMGIEIEAQPAERSEPILPPDRPWEQDGGGPVTSFIFKDGLYIIDYTTPAGLCRAQSEDGYNWTKPEFGAVEFEGSTKNNIVTTRYGRIFEDPSAPPEERSTLGARWRRPGHLFHLQGWSVHHRLHDTRRPLPGAKRRWL